MRPRYLRRGSSSAAACGKTAHSSAAVPTAAAHTAHVSKQSHGVPEIIRQMHYFTVACAHRADMPFDARGLAARFRGAAGAGRVDTVSDVRGGVTVRVCTYAETCDAALAACKVLVDAGLAVLRVNY